MLRFSRITDYAVVVLAAMARAKNELLPASELATRTGLAEPTVAKVLKLLAKGKIISSTRGTAGGYRLKNAAEDVRISAIIAAMEGPVRLATCVDEKEPCALETICAVRGRWNPVNEAVEKALDKVTLADMMPSVLTRASLPQLTTRLVVAEERKHPFAGIDGLEDLEGFEGLEGLE
jgi:FeS assembly SUF system regulator